MKLHQSDRAHPHRQKGDPRRRRKAVVRKGREASPPSRRRHRATRAVLCIDRQRYRRRPYPE